MSRKLVVTGANGFVGSALARSLQRKGEQVLGLCRRSASLGFPVAEVPSFREMPALTQVLSDAEVVIHCAARVHIMSDSASDLLESYRQVNTAGTLNLAEQAARSGVRRFIYISSIKVNGEATLAGHPFRPDDSLVPTDPYAISKAEAETGLLALAERSEMEVVIIRPPLVYGPGVKGNFASLLKLVETGLPLPLGAIHNKRSLVALDNLVDLIITCVDHPAAANQTFLAADGEDLSTSDLLRRLAIAMGRPSRLIPVPAGLLLLGATALGKKAMARRLLGSLQVDISKTEETLGWMPPLSVDEGLRRCFANYQGE